MSDLDLPLRGRTYREPEGPHVAVAGGRDLGLALEHVAARADCRGLALTGPLPAPAGLEVLAGRRLLVCDGDRGRLRRFAEQGVRAGAAVEWAADAQPGIERLGAWALPVGAVVLAAGAGTRMGANKLLLEIGDQPLVRHVIEAAAEGGSHAVHVVYADSAVRDAVGQSAVCVFNPDAATGQASSLRAGLRSLAEEIAGALVMLGDQPLVGARTVRRLLGAWRAEGARAAVAAGYGGDGWAPPVVLDRSLWPDLERLTGDRGARALFEERPDLIDTVPTGGRPDDVDTPEDYDRVIRLFPQHRLDPR